MNNKVFLRARIKLASLYTMGVILIFAGGFSLNYWFDKILAEPNVDPLLHSAEALTVILIAALSYHYAGRTLRPVEAAYEQQEKFVADAAHELRTPLAVMKTGAEATLATEASAGAYKKLIGEILEEVDYMSNTVNDLLLLVKHDGRQVRHHEKVDLGGLLQAQSKHIQPYADSKNITLINHIVASCYVLGNTSDLQRLITNLLRNAIDYNTPKGSVSISLQKSKQTIVLSVIDTGLGIAPKDLSRIFSRFYKVDQARGQDSGGAGLGLSIVKEIAHAHRARISIESRLGKGTVATIIFPAVSS